MVWNNEKLVPVALSSCHPHSPRHPVTPVTLVNSLKIQIQSRRPFLNNWESCYRISSGVNCWQGSFAFRIATQKPPVWCCDKRIHQGATTLRLSAAGLMAPQFSLDRLGGNLWTGNCRNQSRFELQANNLISVKICKINNLSKHSINAWLLTQDFGEKYQSSFWSEDPHQIQNK